MGECQEHLLPIVACYLWPLQPPLASLLDINSYALVMLTSTSLNTPQKAPRQHEEVQPRQCIPMCIDLK
eukprot:4000212-Amphidinium_carterae.1